MCIDRLYSTFKLVSAMRNWEAYLHRKFIDNFFRQLKEDD